MNRRLPKQATARYANSAACAGLPEIPGGLRRDEGEERQSRQCGLNNRGP